MATLSVRVEEDLRIRAEEAASAAGQSVSEWARQLMRAELGMDVPGWSGPASLTKRDRAQLVLLHTIAAQLAEEEYDAEYHRTMIEVLESGYTLEYSDEFRAIGDEMPLEECRLMLDILDMFRMLEFSLKALEPEVAAKIDGADRALRFGGLDFNDSREGRLASYAKYLIDQGKWAELAVYFDDEHERGNSHWPMLDAYLRMLAVFQPIWNTKISGAGRGHYDLDPGELARVAHAFSA